MIVKLAIKISKYFMAKMSKFCIIFSYVWIFVFWLMKKQNLRNYFIFCVFHVTIQKSLIFFAKKTIYNIFSKKCFLPHYQSLHYIHFTLFPRRKTALGRKRMKSVRRPEDLPRAGPKKTEENGGQIWLAVAADWAANISHFAEGNNFYFSSPPQFPPGDFPRASQENPRKTPK